MSFVSFRQVVCILPQSDVPVSRYNAANGRSAFALSPSGSIVFVTGANTTGADGRRIMLFDRSDKSGKQIGPSGRYVQATLSPDGRMAVVGVDNPASPNIRVLSLMDMDRGVFTRFTTGSDDERNPVWAPDNQSVVFTSRRGAAYGVYRRSAGGGATRDELLFSSPEPVTATGFSSDGTLLLMTRGVAADQRVWVLPLTGDKKPVQAFPGLTIAHNGAVFSPNDKWIAYIEASGPSSAEVYVRPIPLMTGASACLRRWAGRRTGRRMASPSSTGPKMTRLNRSFSSQTAGRSPRCRP